MRLGRHVPKKLVNVTANAYEKRSTPGGHFSCRYVGTAKMALFSSMPLI